MNFKSAFAKASADAEFFNKIRDFERIRGDERSRHKFDQGMQVE